MPLFQRWFSWTAVEVRVWMTNSHTTQTIWLLKQLIYVSKSKSKSKKILFIVGTL